MRKATRFAFLMLLAAGVFYLSEADNVLLADECTAPGLVGNGATEYEAVLDCYNYAVEHCSNMCWTGCQTGSWYDYECNAQQAGGGWTAGGRCKCGISG